MSIGNFQDPDAVTTESADNSSKGKPSTPNRSVVEGIQHSLKKSVSQQQNTVEKATSWKERLREKDISLDKAHTMIDDLITKGFYEESFPITSRISVTFRSRTQYDFQRYLRALEVINPRFNDELHELASRYFLAASLAHFGTTSFDFPDIKESRARVDAAFEKRMDWVESQPGHLVILLTQKLNAFDEMLATVFSEGVIENF